eukprot:3589712-Rhodomonas_salina.4
MEAMLAVLEAMITQQKRNVSSGSAVTFLVVQKMVDIEESLKGKIYEFAMPCLVLTEVVLVPGRGGRVPAGNVHTVKTGPGQSATCLNPKIKRKNAHLCY